MQSNNKKMCRLEMIWLVKYTIYLLPWSVLPPDGSSRLAGLASEEGVGHELVAADDAAVMGMSCPKLVKIIGRTKKG